MQSLAPFFTFFRAAGFSLLVLSLIHIHHFCSEKRVPVDFKPYSLKSYLSLPRVAPPARLAPDLESPELMERVSLVVLNTCVGYPFKFVRKFVEKPLAKNIRSDSGSLFDQRQKSGAFEFSRLEQVCGASTPVLGTNYIMDRLLFVKGEFNTCSLAWAYLNSKHRFIHGRFRQKFYFSHRI